MKICEPYVADGNVTLLELLVIDSLVAVHKPSAVFEIGTFDGRTTLNLAANTEAAARIYTLDLPRAAVDKTKLPLDHGDRRFITKDISGLRYRGRPESVKITQLYGDSATFDFSPYENGMDLVFVDGSHAAPYVRNDSEKAFRLLRERRGVIVWHDYQAWSGVTSVLEEFYRHHGDCRNMKHVAGTSLVVLVLS